jgi:hypothetical protein
MPEAANYTVIQQGDITLPDRDSNNDPDFEYPAFGAPGLSTSTSPHDRPFLLFSVNPGGVCELELELNETVVFSKAFGEGNLHSVNEILDHGDLLASGNNLIVRSVSGATFTISDMAVGYKVNV